MPEAFGWVALLFALVSLPYFMHIRPKRVRFAGVSAELRSQLGDTLAGLLVTTRWPESSPYR
jgi:hypothetical protein